MGIHKVDQKSVSYRILWYAIKVWYQFFFYRKIEVSHQERVPQKGAIVFAGNHQNALMDALALLFSAKRTIVFLARADIFKKNFVAEMLYFLRILPVFRPRDGHSEVKKNQETFDKTTEVLEKNMGLAIFPEGTHVDKHSLTTLKKGFARIVYQTEEGNDFNMDIKIVPVGILYSNYQDCQSVLSINYGEPISLSKYYQLYQEHPAKAYNKAAEDLSQAIKKYMVHIEDDKYYESIDFLQTNFQTSILGGKKYKNRIEAGQEAVSKIVKVQEDKPSSFEAIHHATSKFLSLSTMMTPKQRSLFIHWNSSEFAVQALLFILLLPVLFWAYAVLFFPVLISKISTIPIQDTQFKSTIKFVVTLIVFPLFFIVELLVFQTVFPYLSGFYFLGIYLVSLILAVLSAAWIRRSFNRCYLFIMKLAHPKKWNQWTVLVSSIKNMLLENCNK